MGIHLSLLWLFCLCKESREAMSAVHVLVRSRISGAHLPTENCHSASPSWGCCWTTSAGVCTDAVLQGTKTLLCFGFLQKWSWLYLPHIPASHHYSWGGLSFYLWNTLNGVLVFPVFTSSFEIMLLPTTLSPCIPRLPKPGLHSPGGAFFFFFCLADINRHNRPVGWMRWLDNHCRFSNTPSQRGLGLLTEVSSESGNHKQAENDHCCNGKKDSCQNHRRAKVAGFLFPWNNSNAGQRTASMVFKC